MEPITQTLIFSDGTELEKSHALKGRHELYIYVEDSEKTLTSVFTILSYPEKTKRIIYKFDNVELTFDGYTKLISIRDEGNGITAILEKGGLTDGE